ncbi:MAG: hypothetical protein EOP86_09930, partial [Verrucomicrobiaceae bacterium]
MPIPFFWFRTLFAPVRFIFPSPSTLHSPYARRKPAVTLLLLAGALWLAAALTPMVRAQQQAGDFTYTSNSSYITLT